MLPHLSAKALASAEHPNISFPFQISDVAAKRRNRPSKSIGSVGRNRPMRVLAYEGCELPKRCSDTPGCRCFEGRKCCLYGSQFGLCGHQIVSTCETAISVLKQRFNAGHLVTKKRHLTRQSAGTSPFEESCAHR